MFQCSICGLLIGPEDQKVPDQPSRPCGMCHVSMEDDAWERRHGYVDGEKKGWD